MTDSKNEEKLAVRYAIDEPGRGWRRFPVADALAAYKGLALLPQYAGLSVRVATVDVVMRGQRPTRIQRIEIAVWKFDSDGRVDQEENMRRVLSKLSGVATQQSEVTQIISEEELKLIRRCLGLPHNAPILPV